MLDTITIQNFKSLKDVTVNLQKVNLLIGPNNSGKSNFLKALVFVKKYLNQKSPTKDEFNRVYFNQVTSLVHQTRKEPVLFEFKWNQEKADAIKPVYHLEVFGYDLSNLCVYKELIGRLQSTVRNGTKLADIDTWLKNLDEFWVSYGQSADPKFIYFRSDRIKELVNFRGAFIHYNEGKIEQTLQPFLAGSLLRSIEKAEHSFVPEAVEVFNSIKIYKPDPGLISKESLLLFDKSVNESCSNLVAFLDNMRDEYPHIWNAIEKDLNRCIPEFEGINFGKISIRNDDQDTNNIGKRFGLRNKWGRTYWAEELSEGTIYFLALLAIIHQPDPPKLILLEEPEKGIHPRRISEVMNLIFRLAEEKDIQLIITTHSTQVVDEFQDIPESVFVFELQDGETKIKNLLNDIIEPDNKKADDKGYSKLDFSKHSLGEHWAIGFLGGVPAK